MISLHMAQSNRSLCWVLFQVANKDRCKCTNVQADLSFPWVPTSFCRFGFKFIVNTEVFINKSVSPFLRIFSFISEFRHFDSNLK